METNLGPESVELIPQYQYLQDGNSLQLSLQTGEWVTSLDPPVPRRLVVESPVPGNLPTTHPDPFGPLPAIRVGGKHEKIRANMATGLQFRRLPVRPGDQVGFYPLRIGGQPSKRS